MTEMAWYSIDQKGKTQDHPPVKLEEALQIARKYYANAEKTYQTAEEGIAETMFGFMRDKTTFIELCINGPADISCRFEMPKKPDAMFFRGVFQRQTLLASIEEIEKTITDFYTREPMQFRERRAARRA
ncbi:MAG TPA: hypothetical protein VL625_07270 [Patescibacteria group bacterium]|nr:hypothetical protein [Patescibacteria group bacterium]